MGEKISGALPNGENSAGHLKLLWLAFAILAMLCPQLPIGRVFTAVTGFPLPTLSACTDPSCSVATTVTPAPPAAIPSGIPGTIFELRSNLPTMTAPPAAASSPVVP